jgi:hypothetical protein
VQKQKIPNPPPPPPAPLVAAHRPGPIVPVREFPAGGGGERAKVSFPCVRPCRGSRGAGRRVRGLGRELVSSRLVSPRLALRARMRARPLPPVMPQCAHTHTGAVATVMAARWPAGCWAPVIGRGVARVLRRPVDGAARELGSDGARGQASGRLKWNGQKTGTSRAPWAPCCTWAGGRRGKGQGLWWGRGPDLGSGDPWRVQCAHAPRGPPSSARHAPAFSCATPPCAHTHAHLHAKTRTPWPVPPRSLPHASWKPFEVNSCRNRPAARTRLVRRLHRLSRHTMHHAPSPQFAHYCTLLHTTLPVRLFAHFISRSFVYPHLFSPCTPFTPCRGWPRASQHELVVVRRSRQ